VLGISGSIARAVACRHIVSRTENHARRIGGKENHYRCNIVRLDPKYAERCLGSKDLSGLGFVSG
jgi:hypothetical protein